MIIPQQGWSQMTPATQNTIRKAAGGTARASGSKRRKKRSKGSKSGTKKKRAATRASGNKFVKGSAAAKAHMAKLRRKRGKKKK